MHPAVSSLYYEVKTIPLSNLKDTFWTYFETNSDKFQIEMYNKAFKETWLNFIMQVMETDVLMKSLGIPVKAESMSCLREWIGLLLDIGVAIGCFKLSENEQTLVAVDVLYVRHRNDIIPTTKLSSYSQDVIPFLNYLKLTNIGHREHWHGSGNNKFWPFMTSVGLVVDPLYQNSLEMENIMLRKRHLVTGCANKKKITSIFVGKKPKDLKNNYNYTVICKIEKTAKKHDIHFITRDEFEILFATRSITKEDMSPKKGVRGNSKRKGKVCSAEFCSDKTESDTEDMTLENMNISRESSNGGFIETIIIGDSD